MARPKPLSDEALEILCDEVPILDRGARRLKDVIAAVELRMPSISIPSLRAHIDDLADCGFLLVLWNGAMDAGVCVAWNDAAMFSDVHDIPVGAQVQAQLLRAAARRA